MNAAKRGNPQYTLYHPKWHRARIPIFWWLRTLAYTKFITRELTSLFVGYSAVLLLVQIWMLTRGEETYERFVSWLQSPPMVIFHSLVLLAVLFHTITWFNLAPKALVMRLGGRRIPDAVVLMAHYAAWLVATGVVVWLLLGR